MCIVHVYVQPYSGFLSWIKKLAKLNNNDTYPRKLAHSLDLITHMKIILILISGGRGVIIQ